MKKLSLSLSLLTLLAGCADTQDAPAPAAPTATRLTANAGRNTSGFGVLYAGDYLLPGDGIKSSRVGDINATYYFVLQGDGNLVAYDTSVSPWRALWATGTVGSGANQLIMQEDGNLVLYNTNTGRAVWNAGTQGNPDARFTAGPTFLESDGRRFALTISGYKRSNSASGYSARLIKRLYHE